MSGEHIWAVHDIIIIIVGILVIVTLIVLDILFCNYFGGFCALRWTLNLFGTMIYNGVTNLFLKAFIWGVMRAVDLIPL
jgi:hypothetical protein